MTTGSESESAQCTISLLLVPPRCFLCSQRRRSRSRWRVPSRLPAGTTASFTAAAAVLLGALLCLVGVADANLACSPGVVHTYQFETTVEKSVVELRGDQNRVLGKVTVADVLQLSAGVVRDSEGLGQEDSEGVGDSELGQGCLRVIEVHLMGSVGEGGGPTSQYVLLPPVAILQRDTGA